MSSDTPTLFALHQAAKEGNAPLLKKANKKDINKGDNDGWTAMHWAAWSGNPDSLKILVSKGGDVEATDHKGSTPLHVAATYGHEDALELLISKNANLYALDNNGRTAAKVAAFYQKVDCCRFLDTLSVRWEVQNQEFVLKMQKKAMRELQRRTKKSSKEESRSGTSTPVSYDYSTAPSGNLPLRDRAVRPSSGGPTGRKGHKTSLQEALRQNFELRHTGSSENVENNDLGASKSATELLGLPQSGSSTFRAIHRPHEGALLNSLAELPLRIERDESTRDSVAHGILKPRGPVNTQNDSPFTTFLHSIDLADYVESLHKEKLDLDALGMCSEDDFVRIGLPLGPRKKILNAIEKRKRVIRSSTKKMYESEF